MENAAGASTYLGRLPGRQEDWGLSIGQGMIAPDLNSCRHVVFENGRAGVAALPTAISSMPGARACARTASASPLVTPSFSVTSVIVSFTASSVAQYVRSRWVATGESG